MTIPYFKNGYSDVNGLAMYYEIYGQGTPIVLVHGGGSTIQVSFEKIIPQLATNRQVIAMDLQAHGRTNDRDAHLSFDQDADDVAQLLKNIEVSKADFVGFSNGGQTLIALALRHPNLVNSLVICSAFYKRSGTFPQFWVGFDCVTFHDMPQQFKDEFLKVNNNPAALMNMFNKDVHRMKTFKDWTDEQLKLIQAPTYILNSTEDVGTPEHAVEMYRLIPNCSLTILPGGHGEYIGQADPKITDSKLPGITATLIEKFLIEHT